MKRTFFVAAAFLAAFTVSAASAQTHCNNKIDNKIENDFLPKKGDIATGVDLVGMARFLGNTMSAKPEGAAVTPFQGDFSAKYFLSDRIALRAHFGIASSNTVRQVPVIDDLEYRYEIKTTARVIDEERRKNRDFSLGLGAEYRRGSRRVQGYAGAGLFFGLGSGSVDYTYGNDMTADNSNPSTGFYREPMGYWIFNEAYRPLESSHRTISFGMSIFTGVDYFISRSVSLGFEFRLVGSRTVDKATGSIYEMTKRAGSDRWDPDAHEYVYDYTYSKVTETLLPKQKHASLTPAGTANLMFYF